MNSNIITLILVLFFSSYCWGFNPDKIDYHKRLETIKKLNDQLAEKIVTSKKICFDNPRFYPYSYYTIPPSNKILGMAKLHAYDMEKGFSHMRGLDDRREKEKNHPGRLVLDLITDMLKEEILYTDIKTYQVLLKIGCVTNKLFTKFNLVSHLTTTAEKKVVRIQGGNCWDHSHVAKRIAKALGIPLKRRNKGAHMFLSYKFKTKEGKTMHFAFDPLFCPTTGQCFHEFLNDDLTTLERPEELRSFFDNKMKEEKCFSETMGNDPRKLLFFK